MTEAAYQLETGLLDDAEAEHLADTALPEPVLDLTGNGLTDTLADALGLAEDRVPSLAVLAELPDALELLGRLQALGDRLAVLIAQTERDLDQRDAKRYAGPLPSGAVVTVEPGSLRYDWVPVRDVLKALLHDLIPRDDGDPAPDVWEIVNRIEAAVPASVQWKAAGVKRYAEPDEMRASHRSRRRVKVTQPGPVIKDVTA